MSHMDYQERVYRPLLERRTDFRLTSRRHRRAPLLPPQPPKDSNEEKPNPRR